MAQHGSRHNKFDVLPKQTGVVYKAVSSFPAPPTSNPLGRSTSSSRFATSKNFGSSSMPDWSSLPLGVPVEKPNPIASYAFESTFFLESDKLPTHNTPRFHNAFVSNLDRGETLRSIVDACKELDIRDICPEEELGRARGTFFAKDHGVADFSFSLYSAEYDGATRVFAQVISGSGCRIAFSRFTSELIKILKEKGVVCHTEICESVWDPRICPLLPLVEPEDDGLERLKAQVNSCLSDCESGFARTIGEDAPQLARFSEDEQSRTVLKGTPHILERLIKLIEPSFECVLVRSALVCLVNLCDGDEQIVRECRDKHSMFDRLTNLRDRWSRTQYPFGQDFPHSVVDPSREIMFQADCAISKLS